PSPPVPLLPPADPAPAAPPFRVFGPQSDIVPAPPRPTAGQARDPAPTGRPRALPAPSRPAPPRPDPRRPLDCCAPPIPRTAPGGAAQRAQPTISLWGAPHRPPEIGPSARGGVAGAESSTPRGGSRHRPGVADSAPATRAPSLVQVREAPALPA